jgi:hypothetical protein
METKCGVPTRIPQFINGKLITVPFTPEQYFDIKLLRSESVMAVTRFRMKFKLTGQLNVEEIKEALRQGREKKHFDIKNSEYFKKVNNKR